MIDRELLDILVCPVTLGPLRYDPETEELISDKAGLAYAVRDGIPVMLPDEARQIEDSEAISVDSSAPSTDQPQDKD